VTVLHVPSSLDSGQVEKAHNLSMIEVHDLSMFARQVRKNNALQKLSKAADPTAKNVTLPTLNPKRYREWGLRSWLIVYVLWFRGQGLRLGVKGLGPRT